MNKVIIRRIVSEVIQIATTQFAINNNNRLNITTNKVTKIAIFNSITTRQNTNELDFFNLYYNNKTIYSDISLIEYTNKDTYFRNIYLFLNRVK